MRTWTRRWTLRASARKVNGLRMLAGDIDRDPLKGKCNKYCEYQPICRLERAVGLEDDGENGGPE